ncbi:MAG TPA: polyphosphate kinase 1 [Thermoflexales bacterium]|nr:polyphosphate kinase 1 [Thermoflexales bacterium]HQW36145.1 polyphosphate kinase 1 [Thermoflexales bacterium]HQZ21962.1 polyphosphate kinase 1 [Thermoflexales bacterium]HQZ99219.1 polyphosphate kinase 1 [Thermoflexales bacterium]
MSDGIPSPACYINREASWIEFNRRVLQESQNKAHPLLERVKFLAIFATNLDEFFMIRVSGLREQLAARVQEVSPDGRTPRETMDLIRERLQPLIHEHSETWLHDIKPALEKEGVFVLDYAELSEEQRAQTQAYFRREVFPVLTPLAFDPGHPFPHISNLSLNLAVALTDEKDRERFARVKVPPILPRLIALEPKRDDNGNGNGDGNGEHHFIWLDQMIEANIQDLFPGMSIQGTYVFRVTRDTDIEIQVDEADDLLATIEKSIDTRRWGDVVRLEIDHEMPDHIRDMLMDNLELHHRDVYSVSGPMNMADLWEVVKLPLAALKDPPMPHYIPDAISRPRTDGIFEAIREGDILLQHPYDSFTPVVDFVQTAARDPQVLAIKITLYRVGSNSPIVKALIEAIENGKQVAAMVELKARFDEENNIGWARALEKAGVHVIYGFANLKVHTKVCLVVRKEQDGIRRYVHLGTGNYNATTARIYTDMSMFTCRDEIGEDVSGLFNILTGYSNQREFKQLLVAPVTMREKLTALIHREIETHKRAGNGYLLFKANALVDPDLIAQLYEASKAGVKVDLLIRGMCSLCPGVPGLSDNIRVVSIVGRFLEHSRVYCFNNGGDEEVYMGSADMMQRNLDRRVETIFPVIDLDLRRLIRHEILALQLQDNVKARNLDATGQYHLVSPQNGQEMVNSQEIFLGRRDM